MFKELYAKDAFLRECCNICEEPLTRDDVQTNRTRSEIPLCTGCKERQEYYKRFSRK